MSVYEQLIPVSGQYGIIPVFLGLHADTGLIVAGPAAILLKKSLEKNIRLCTVPCLDDMVSFTIFPSICLFKIRHKKCCIINK